MNADLADPRTDHRQAGQHEASDARRAERDFIRAIATDLPDPQSFVRYLDVESFHALTHCILVNNNGWRLPHGTTERVRKSLEQLSVTQLGGWFLTVWGMQVRKAAREVML